MVGYTREQGLSEVIGFLMIVALLAILFSMYLVYVVPIQGRDAEIAHMDLVKEQMTGVKMDIDSLIVNKKLNYPIQRTIPLGTSPGSASGAFSLIPMQTYTGSSGTLTVNTNPGGNLEIYIRGTGVRSNPQNQINNADFSVPAIPIVGSTSFITINPQSFILSYNISSQANLSPNITISSNNWSVTAQVVPRYEKEFVNWSPGSPSDLTITIRKDANLTMDNLTIAGDVSNTHNPYPINLYDWGYGLADSLQRTYNFTCLVNGVQTIPRYSVGQTVYIPLTNERVVPGTFFNSTVPEVAYGLAVSHNLSTFEYESQNRYWVNQKYQYQWGGMFINQSDGTSVLYTPPISINNTYGVIQINLLDMNIQTYNSAITKTDIGGNQMNPTLVSLRNLSTSIGGMELIDEPMNADYLIVSTTNPTPQEQTKWMNAFNYIQLSAERTGKVANTNIRVTPLPYEVGENLNRVSLFIASGNFDVKDVLDNSVSLEDAINKFYVVGGEYEIDNPNLKITYQSATVPISLYNLAQ
ncbi:MAG: hypothetical protein V1862_04115 [Methanobacteriota archaeon]